MNKKNFFEKRKELIDNRASFEVDFRVKKNQIVATLDGNEYVVANAGDRVKNQFGMLCAEYTYAEACQDGLLEAHNGSVHANIK